MKISKLYKPLMSGLLCTALLSGFTGKEKFLEIEGMLNGRSSSNFTARSGNVISLLLRGTRGEILETRQLPSGNYGIKIKVINGVHAGQTMWVYHERRDDTDLKFFSSKPTTWENAKQTANVEEALAAETKRDIEAQKDSEQKTDSQQEPSKSSDAASAQDAIDAINKSNQKVNQSADCGNCSVAPTAGKHGILRKARRSMVPACNKFMNSQGQIGPRGQIVYSTMAEPQFRKYYLKRNALGAFCPNFNNLSDSDKLTAWTWFWTALAREESACQPYVNHLTVYNGRTINPTFGYGLWALEKIDSERRWRGPSCREVSDVQGQVRCAVSIMKNTQLDSGDTASSDQNSYWGPVRRGNRQIMPHMKRLTLCFPK